MCENRMPEKGVLNETLAQMTESKQKTIQGTWAQRISFLFTGTFQIGDPDKSGFSWKKIWCTIVAIVNSS